jgi:hypothetical protein
MVVPTNDVVTPSAAALQVFETAAQPKKLVIIPGGHFDASNTSASDAVPNLLQPQPISLSNPRVRWHLIARLFSGPPRPRLRRRTRPQGL